jgi:hypothetical protein
MLLCATTNSLLSVWSGSGALGTSSQIALDFRGSFEGTANNGSVGGEVDELVTSGPNKGTSGGDGGGMFGSAL